MLLLSAAARTAAARAAKQQQQQQQLFAVAVAASTAAAAGRAGVTTQAPGGKGAGGTNVTLGSTTATAAGTGYAQQEDWMTRGAAAGERAEKVAEGAMKEAPEFGLHRAGLGFDLSALADAIRSSWGGRAPQAAEAVAKMVADPSAARRVPFPPPRQPTAKPGAAAKGEDEEDEDLHLPLRWRRMAPDANKDDWYEIPTEGKQE